jgi:hypothetical protein
MVGMTHEMNLRKRKRKKEKNAYHNTGRMEVEEWLVESPQSSAFSVSLHKGQP